MEDATEARLVDRPRQKEGLITASYQRAVRSTEYRVRSTCLPRCASPITWYSVPAECQPPGLEPKILALATCDPQGSIRFCQGVA